MFGNIFGAKVDVSKLKFPQSVEGVKTEVTFTHWLPIKTYCPVNEKPDYVFVEVVADEYFEDLYQVRKRIKALIAGRTEFMETLTQELLAEFPEAKEVRFRLMFNKHIIRAVRQDV